MSTHRPVLVLLALGVLAAAEEAAQTASAKNALQEYEKGVTAARTNYDQSLQKHADATIAGLQKEMDAAMGRKDLDGAQAIKKILDQMKDGTLPRLVEENLASAKEEQANDSSPGSKGTSEKNKHLDKRINNIFRRRALRR
jgi:hypothetical protein